MKLSGSTYGWCSYEIKPKGPLSDEKKACPGSIRKNCNLKFRSKIYRDKVKMTKKCCYQCQNFLKSSSRCTEQEIIAIKHLHFKIYTRAGLECTHLQSVRRTSSPEKSKETFFRVRDIVNVKIIGWNFQGVLMDGVAMK